MSDCNNCMQVIEYQVVGSPYMVFTLKFIYSENATKFDGISI